ncbi:MAG: hypothetical protein LUE22_09590 [Oscillospiraceae bacterium]|nr:hypothetical protein [Oscillospiraceae bacterium]
MSSNQTRPQTKISYYIEPKGTIWIAVGFMALSFGLRLAWWLVWPEDTASAGVYVHGVLPLGACVLFCLCLLYPGRMSLRASFLPALLGVLFFILKAQTFVWWHQTLCTLLHLLVAVLYGLTAFSVLPLRKLLFPLFGLPLTFHAIVLDLIVHRTVFAWPDWFQEWSVLCIMAGLLCVAFAIREERPAVQEAAS